MQKNQQMKESMSSPQKQTPKPFKKQLDDQKLLETPYPMKFHFQHHPPPHHLPPMDGEVPFHPIQGFLPPPHFHFHQMRKMMGKNWKQFRKDQQNHNHIMKNEDQKSDSGSESSSEDSIEGLEKGIENLTMKDKKDIKNKTYKEFELAFSELFQMLNVCPFHKKKIVKCLSKRYNGAKDLTPLMSTIQDLMKESPQYFNSFNLLKIIKEIFKNGFHIKQINGSLDRILFIRAKKEQRDEKYETQKGKHPPIQFLNTNKLQELDHEKLLFLVDGNNILPTQKIFRQYYNSFEDKEKAEGQIRLCWLIAETGRGQLFFDNKFSDEIYGNVKKQVLPESKREILSNVPVHFADKEKDPSATADMKIIDRVKQIKEKNEYEGSEIVLVSADRELSHLCREVADIKKTSGMFFFKYCRQFIKHQIPKHPENKGIIKKILKD